MTRDGTKMRRQENGITNSIGSKMKPLGNGIMRTGKNESFNISIAGLAFYGLPVSAKLADI